jgi:transglutaminase/protease-like cytokinesis protein 3
MKFNIYIMLTICWNIFLFLNKLNRNVIVHCNNHNIQYKIYYILKNKNFNIFIWLNEKSFLENHIFTKNNILIIQDNIFNNHIIFQPFFLL